MHSGLNFRFLFNKKGAVSFDSYMVQKPVQNAFATPAAPIILATCTYALPHSKYGSCVREIRGEAERGSLE